MLEQRFPFSSKSLALKEMICSGFVIDNLVTQVRSLMSQVFAMILLASLTMAVSDALRPYERAGLRVWILNSKNG